MDNPSDHNALNYLCTLLARKGMAVENQATGQSFYGNRQRQGQVITVLPGDGAEGQDPALVQQFSDNAAFAKLMTQVVIKGASSQSDGMSGYAIEFTPSMPRERQGEVVEIIERMVPKALHSTGYGEEERYYLASSVIGQAENNLNEALLGPMATELDRIAGGLGQG